jgi:[acyl-carrier-protein] S-malonyltransferase
VIGVANINCPGQVVIAGAQQALAKAMDNCRLAGAKRVLPLKVAGAFHTPLMTSAADGLREALQQATFSPAVVPVVQNVDAQPTTDPEKLKENLVNQLTNPVLWLQCIQQMVGLGAEQFMELGPGKTVAGMIKRISRDVPCMSLGAPEHFRS